MKKKERINQALDIAMNYGGYDGGHHKMWTIDQMVRALCGVPMVTKKAKDYKGQEYTYETLGTNEAYDKWVKNRKSGEDGPDTYGWDEGIAP